MKKAVLILLLSFISIMPIKADLTSEQSEDLAFFAEKFIVEGNKRISSDGFPIFAYMQGQARIDGFQSKLYKVTYDYQRKNKVNAYKWTFDCSSFAAFVYYKTFGLVLTKYTTSQVDSYSGLNLNSPTANPYEVKDYVTNADKEKHFYYIMRNVEVPKIDYSQLQKGDLIIIVGSHIMVYIGDGKISHASSSAITSSNLGLEINNLSTKYPNKKVSVIRLKDGIIDPNKKTNLTITWPDNLEVLDMNTLRNANDLPVITYKKSTDDWTTQLTLNISLTDSDGLTNYSFNDELKEISGNEYSFSKEIKENGTYNLTVQDKLNNISKQTIEIANIDNMPPIITSFSSNNKGNYSVLSVIAEDVESGLADAPYSFDNKRTWTNKTTYEVSKNGEYYVYVKDNNDNISSLKVNVELNETLTPMINNVINGEVTDNKRKITISILNNNSNNKISITKDRTEPAAREEWQDLVGDSYTTYLEEGTYYIWLKDNYSNVIGPHKIELKLDNNESKIDIKTFIYLVPFVFVLISIFLFIKYKNNKI